MASLDDIRALGYTVGVAQDHAGDPQVGCDLVYRVEGFGVSTMLRDSDQAEIDAFADAAAHAERAYQHEHGQPSSPDPTPPPPPTAREIVASALGRIDVAKLKTPADVVAALKKAFAQ